MTAPSLFIILLRFAGDRDRSAAVPHMHGHRAWIKRGFDDGVFLLAGSVEPDAGGALIARHVSREELQARVDADPFVAAGVVHPEIIELEPVLTEPRLEFLRH